MPSITRHLPLYFFHSTSQFGQVTLYFYSSTLHGCQATYFSKRSEDDLQRLNNTYESTEITCLYNSPVKEGIFLKEFCLTQRDKKKNQNQNTQTKLFSALTALKSYLYGYSCIFYQSIYLILFFQQDSWLMKLICSFNLLWYGKEYRTLSPKHRLQVSFETPSGI